LGLLEFRIFTFLLYLINFDFRDQFENIAELVFVALHWIRSAVSFHLEQLLGAFIKHLFEHLLLLSEFNNFVLKSVVVAQLLNDFLKAYFVVWLMILSWWDKDWLLKDFVLIVIILPVLNPTVILLSARLIIFIIFFSIAGICANQGMFPVNFNLASYNRTIVLLSNCSSRCYWRFSRSVGQGRHLLYDVALWFLDDYGLPCRYRQSSRVFILLPLLLTFFKHRLDSKLARFPAWNLVVLIQSWFFLLIIDILLDQCGLLWVDLVRWHFVFKNVLFSLIGRSLSDFHCVLVILQLLHSLLLSHWLSFNLALSFVSQKVDLEE